MASDRSKLINTIGHVSIVVVFCVIVGAMGLGRDNPASDQRENMNTDSDVGGPIMVRLSPVSKQHAQRVESPNAACTPAEGQVSHMWASLLEGRRFDDMMEPVPCEGSAPVYTVYTY